MHKLIFALGLMSATASASEAAGPMRIELNRIEPAAADSCRSYLMVTNGSATLFRSFKLDLFAFDTDGVIAKRVALDLGPLSTGKTAVRVFDFTGLPCGRLSRILLNDVVGCETAEGPKTDCLSLIDPATRTAVAFGL